MVAPTAASLSARQWLGLWNCRLTPTSPSISQVTNPSNYPRMPVLTWGPKYNLHALRGDVIAGLSVAVMLVGTRGRRGRVGRSAWQGGN